MSEPSLAIAAIRPRSALPGTIFEPDDGPAFRTNYNKAPFKFRHALGEHPLFAIDRLVNLCSFMERQPLKERVIHFTDEAAVTAGWRRSNSGNWTAADALANIRDSHSWVLIKDIQRHPDYAELRDLFIDEISRMTEQPMRSEITWMDTYLFIASPEMITPYHIDHECNFLLQIHGEKSAHVFPCDDRSILKDEEIEAYYIGNLNAAQYREVNESKAFNVRLRPGIGVHQPPLAPHWVKNGSDYSVSLSFLYFLRGFDRRAKIYQVNRMLRSLGMKPTPPGQSRFKDAVKSSFLSDFGYRAQQKEDVVRHAFRRMTAPLRLCRDLTRKSRAR